VVGARTRPDSASPPEQKYNHFRKGNIIMANDTSASDVLKITDENQDAMIKEHSMLVIDCYADWCGPCRMIAPFVVELAGEYSGKVSFGKIDVDQSPGISRQYSISSIPTLLFFKNGKLVDRVIGALPKPALKEKVESLIAA
jgi:thioredoxin 1